MIFDGAFEDFIDHDIRMHAVGFNSQAVGNGCDGGRVTHVTPGMFQKQICVLTPWPWRSEVDDITFCSPWNLCAATDSKAGVDNNLLRQVHHGAIVTVSLIDLNHCEFRIVCGIHTLVPEDPADFIHAFNSTHQQTLQVQLKSNPKIKLHIERVVVGDKRTRRGTTGDRVQYGGFNFVKAMRTQGLPDGINNR